MAIKKSELYSKLWQSCDELRGGMDASQYKDYVLTLLFVKYISDKYAGQDFADIEIPEGATFSAMSALKGKDDIGDRINKEILKPIADSAKLPPFPDFNASDKLGSGKEKIERLTKLIAIFEDDALDFSKNRAGDDDILGDAYEFLMRHFATESGKSKGQFYTPAEVSRIMAKVVGIADAKVKGETTVYDPTCGSGSLLLKVGDASDKSVSLYGQEKDNATTGLARMNLILHDYATAEVKQGNTISNPQFKDDHDRLKTFDYVVANPPFSDKGWTTGIKPEEDTYQRFDDYGIPPPKQGDYAYLLHIVASLKSKGKGACILPHGVLFRGNAEAEIRKNLIRKGYIKAIIGLPANLFYGTGIPACIIVIDKEDATARKGIFMIDASKGFIKDGNKNRLREMDIHRIVDAFMSQTETEPKYGRMVSFAEIEKNEFNLNIPRYIDSQEAEDIQDIAGHLRGGIPHRDIEALDAYWDVCPSLRASLFKSLREGYEGLAIDKSAIKSTIHEHAEFTDFLNSMEAHFEDWKAGAQVKLTALDQEVKPKVFIHELGEGLLDHYANKPLLNEYDVYQHLRDYWDATMQDDIYLIAADGWKAETSRVMVKDKKGKAKDKGWVCDLIPKDLIVARFFEKEAQALSELESKLEAYTAERTELEEEHSGEQGHYTGLEKINKAEVTKRLKAIKKDATAKDEAKALNAWLDLNAQEAAQKKAIKTAETELDKKAYEQYPKLSEEEIKSLVVEDKWLAHLSDAIHGQMEQLSQSLTQRVKELAERYETTLPEATAQVAALEAKVAAHLEKMGFAWQ